MGRLLLPDAECPRCGAAPGVRFPEAERDRYEGEAPGKVVITYRCQNRQCRKVYPITVKAIQGAA